jgi:hypothetical protein
VNVTRRSILLGAVAVPAGITVPAALARELELPPAEPLKTGDSVILQPGRRECVLYLDDLMNGDCRISVVQRDGRILGSYHIVEVSHHIDYDQNHVVNLRGIEREPMRYTYNKLDLKMIKE